MLTVVVEVQQRRGSGKKPQGRVARIALRER
jgi:hypothetical protein